MKEDRVADLNAKNCVEKIVDDLELKDIKEKVFSDDIFYKVFKRKASSNLFYKLAISGLIFCGGWLFALGMPNKTNKDVFLSQPADFDLSDEFKAKPNRSKKTKRSKQTGFKKNLKRKKRKPPKGGFFASKNGKLKKSKKLEELDKNLKRFKEKLKKHAKNGNNVELKNFADGKNKKVREKQTEDAKGVEFRNKIESLKNKTDDSFGKTIKKQSNEPKMKQKSKKRTKDERLKATELDDFLGKHFKTMFKNKDKKFKFPKRLRNKKDLFFPQQEEDLLDEKEKNKNLNFKIKELKKEAKNKERAKNKLLKEIEKMRETKQKEATKKAKNLLDEKEKNKNLNFEIKELKKEAKNKERAKNKLLKEIEKMKETKQQEATKKAKNLLDEKKKNKNLILQVRRLQKEAKTRKRAIRPLLNRAQEIENIVLEKAKKSGLKIDGLKRKFRKRPGRKKPSEMFLLRAKLRELERIGKICGINKKLQNQTFSESVDDEFEEDVSEENKPQNINFNEELLDSKEQGLIDVELFENVNNAKNVCANFGKNALENDNYYDVLPIAEADSRDEEDDLLETGSCSSRGEQTDGCEDYVEEKHVEYEKTKTNDNEDVERNEKETKEEMNEEKEFEDDEFKNKDEESKNEKETKEEMNEEKFEDDEFKNKDEESKNEKETKEEMNEEKFEDDEFKNKDEESKNEKETKEEMNEEKEFEDDEFKNKDQESKNEKETKEEMNEEKFEDMFIETLSKEESENIKKLFGAENWRPKCMEDVLMGSDRILDQTLKDLEEVGFDGKELGKTYGTKSVKHIKFSDDYVINEIRKNFDLIFLYDKADNIKTKKYYENLSSKETAYSENKKGDPTFEFYSE